MLMASALAFANVSAEQIILNDFNDGTNQGWDKGGAAKKPLTNETEADGNGYLRLISEGEDSTDPDKKITFQNASGKWRGNYITKGVQSTSGRFKNNGPDDVELHAAFGNTLANLRTRWISKGVVIPYDGEWHEAFFSFTPEELIMVPLGGHGKSNASFLVQEDTGKMLTLCATMRFSQGHLDDETGQGHSADGIYNGWNGEPEVEADLWIDDIALSTDGCPEGIQFMASMTHCMAN